MFGTSSGSMYEEIEAARNKKLRKKKIIIRRVIVIIVLLIIVSYLGILLNDIRRFKNGENPLIITKYEKKEYDDGNVTSYYSLGWVFRYYDRETIKENKIETSWSKIRMDDILNRKTDDPNLPEIEKNYTVPSNVSKKNKVDGVLFFYNDQEKLLGTYKCILSDKDCDFSSSHILEDDSNKYENIKMGIIDNRYVFIDEYKNKNTEAEEKHVYLYDIVAKHIIAQYQNVRYSLKLKNEKSKSEYGAIYSNKFIVEKNNLWGIDEVDKGKVTNFEDYNYKYIKFDENTKLYILKEQVNKWVIFNSNEKIKTQPFEENIDSLYYKNDKMYVIAYTRADEYSSKRNYILYNQDGENVLKKDNIDDLKSYEKFLVYTNDLKLYFIDYDGNEVINSYNLYYDDTYSAIKAYNINIKDNNLIIKLLKDKSKTHMVNEYYYNLDDFSLIKERKDVKETIE